MATEHTSLDVQKVEFDPDNPRIAPRLEAYEDVDPELVAMALQPGDAKFAELRQAIWTNEGIVNPIIVNRREGRYIAVEGNTRLAIYKMFNRDAPGDERWKRIPSIVHDEMSPDAIDAIRLQAHLVGVRNWTPFAKAQYLYRLNKSEHLSLHELVDFCGGNKNEVLRNIQAYEHMTLDYRPLVAEENFDRRKFSLFYEARRNTIQNALLNGGYTNKNFAEWVRDGKFEPRQELVRKLPAILRSDTAREEFLKNGAASAEKYIDSPDVLKELQNANLVDLCNAMQVRITQLTLVERDVIKNDTDNVLCVEETLSALENLYKHELQ